MKSTTKGARRLYYPADMEVPQNGGGLHEVQARMLKHVEDVPGMSVRDVAALLGISPQLAMYHARKLHEEGLVRLERRGVALHVVPTGAEERRRIRPPKDT